jgi:hypothetical protein
LNISHLSGLILVLQLPRGLVPLLATGNHDNVAKLFKRYLSTQQRVRSWYESDPFDPESSAYKNLRAVRAMHQHVLKLMNGKTGRVIGKDKNIWVSQYDMALTQWAFIGILILYPKECGLHPATKQELGQLIYFWRVMGYLNGIEDQFNLCHGYYDETFTLFQIVWEKIYKPAIIANPHPAPTGYEMSKGLLLAMRPFNPSLKWICFMKYWYKVLEIPIEFKIESPRNRLRYQMMKFSLATLFKFRFFHWLYGSMFYANRNRQISRKKETEEMLKTQFSDISYQTCPYGFDIDNMKAV